MVTILSIARRSLAVAALSLLVGACALIADVGERRSLYPPDGSSGPDASGDTGAPGEVDAAVGLLVHADGAVCVATLVGPSTVLTAAHCFPALGHGCATEAEIAAQWQLALPRGDSGSEGLARYRVHGIAIAPGAYAALTPCAAGATCANHGTEPTLGLQRSHDLALVYVTADPGVDPSAPPPSSIASPKAVLTSISDEVPGPGGRHVYVDPDLAFSEGATVVPLEAGFASLATGAGFRPTRVRSPGAFRLGRYWNTSCEQFFSCNETLDQRDSCTPIPFIGGRAFYMGSALPISEAVATEKQPVRLRVAGSPALFIGGSAAGRFAALPDGDEVVLGALAGPAQVASGGQGTGLYAPTFHEGTGLWLDARLHDFDGDCIDDDADSAPTVPTDPSACRRIGPPGWSTKEDLGSVIPAPLGDPGRFSVAGVPAVVARASGRIDVAVLSHDTVIYVTALERGTWARWRSMDGALAMGPGLAEKKSGALGMLATSHDRALYYREYNDTSALSPTYNELRGIVSAPSSPVAMVPRALGDFDAFVRAEGGRLHQLRRVQNWTKATSTGVPITSTPAAVARLSASATEIVARGADQHLRHWTQATVGASDWSTYDDLGVVASAAAVASNGSEQLDVLARGRDGALLHCARIGGAWTPWREVAWGWTSAPAAVTAPDGTVHVFGRSEHGSLLHTTYRPP